MLEVIGQLAKDFKKIAPGSLRRPPRFRYIGSIATLGSARTRRRSRRTSRLCSRGRGWRAIPALDIISRVSPGWVWIGGGLLFTRDA